MLASASKFSITLLTNSVTLNYSEAKEHQKAFFCCTFAFLAVTMRFFMLFLIKFAFWDLKLKTNAILTASNLSSYFSVWPRSRPHGFWPQPQSSLVSASFSASHCLASASLFTGLINKPGYISLMLTTMTTVIIIMRPLLQRKINCSQLCSRQFKQCL